MIDNLLQIDSEILVYLNNLGSQEFDGLWFAITDQFSWIPLFVLILFFVFKKLGLKQGLFTLLFIAFLVAFSDQFTNFIKNTTERPRPCNTADLDGIIRSFTYKPQSFSFWSGHAFVSTVFSVFIILLLKNWSRLFFILLLYPLVFGYSRIYLGVHYPFDVLVGYLSGTIFGFLMYKGYRYLFTLVFKKELDISE